LGNEGLKIDALQIHKNTLNTYLIVIYIIFKKLTYI
jgi:hypothetical protein